MFTQISSKLLDNKKIIVNAIGFQLAWFICVQGNNLFAALAAIALIILYQMMFKTNSKKWKVLIAFALLGYLGDGIISVIFYLDYSGSFNGGNDSSMLAPLWLFSLWLAFATTLNHSMQWLFKTPYLTVFVALFFVPISYFAGIAMSGSTFSSSMGSFNTGSLANGSFFIAEGLWWAILLVGYQRITASYTAGEVSNV
jgi:hypothetical protein